MKAIATGTIGIFSGVLCAAALTTAASAGFNIHPDSYTSIIVYDSSSGFPSLEIFEVTNGSSVTDHTFNYPGIQGSGTAALSESGMSAEVDVSGFAGNADLVANALFTVDAPTPVLVEWDFAGGSSLSTIGITDWTNSVTLVYEQNFTMGSAQLTLMPGIDYQMLIIADSLAPGSAWSSITIVPAPGVLGAIGFGGMIAVRQRRSREARGGLLSPK